MPSSMIYENINESVGQEDAVVEFHGNTKRMSSDAAAGEQQRERKRKRRSKHVPQRDDTFVGDLRQFMKDQHYTQFDMAANLSCSQAKISHFLCCYMSEKAHNKMVRLAIRWKETTNHSSGLAERARRAYLSQMAQHHVKDSASNGVKRQSSLTHSTAELVPGTADHPNRVHGKDHRVAQQFHYTSSVDSLRGSDSSLSRTLSDESIGRMSASEYCSSKNTHNGRDYPDEAYDENNARTDSYSQYLWKRRERSDSGFISEDAAIAQQQQETCRLELGLKRRAGWCLSCKKGNDCMRRLTEEDIAVAKGLLAIARSPTPTQEIPIVPRKHSVDQLYTRSSLPTFSEAPVLRRASSPVYPTFSDNADVETHSKQYARDPSAFSTTWSSDGIVFTTSVGQAMNCVDRVSIDSDSYTHDQYDI
ncbi:hypothetical protein SARC_02634 [Sphaeroforma arctica JP610]|uniref:Uncharacterized protein n=1 Tax=Sphaeroforma arctica JP610 TaxID=667725 RepID=A0A0L0G822_9EUKA|nr:hypothetical protein SARC_02634 [Sphaeroforma arctica JP610]KNC85177.1 hypothetical protein SARC_02634 [Sphaeroforma arctica JP610]|eukprot:XP_014159079.1 hypothetical protein SARC_02634 [Sphaeroforma arctica JP610]